MLSKLIYRIKNQGVFSAINYYLFTVLGEKVGLEVTKVFIKKANLIECTHENIQIISSESEIPPQLYKEIVEIYGNSIKKQIKNRLIKKSTLALGIIDGHPASMAWLSKVSKKLHKNINTEWLIYGCFTFPNYRGIGLYPQSIDSLSHVAAVRSRSDRSAVIIMESSIANQASINGILKCPFIESGIIIRFRNHILLSRLTSIKIDDYLL